MKTGKFTRAIALALGLGSVVANAAEAQPRAIDHVVAIARPSDYTGACPGTVQFIGTIFVNRPTAVSYRWERSDGATGPVQSVYVGGRGRGVETTWQLGRPGGRYNGSETLHVLSPGDAFSNAARFSLSCGDASGAGGGGPINHVVAIARPRNYEGPCPGTIEFIGTIFVNYPANVSYRWERSDGATGPVQNVYVSGGGRGVETTWQLGTPGEVFHGSETLHVLSPGDARSNSAQFNLACR